MDQWPDYALGRCSYFDGRFWDTFPYLNVLFTPHVFECNSVISQKVLQHLIHIVLEKYIWAWANQTSFNILNFSSLYLAFTMHTHSHNPRCQRFVQSFFVVRHPGWYRAYICIWFCPDHKWSTLLHRRCPYKGKYVLEQSDFPLALL